MEVTYKLPVFEGPLDLLLHLVDKNKVDLRDIPVAEILRQFLEYLGEMEERQLETATEFTVMAATLLYLKSRMLLPRPAGDDEDPRRPLAELLAEYARIKKAAEWLAAALPDGQNTITKPPEPVETRPPRAEDYRHKPDDLARALHRILLRDERRKPVKRASFDAILHRETVTVEEKSDEIRAILARLGEIDVNSLVRSEPNRAHAVAAFLAVLEMCRSGEAYLEGTDAEPVIKLGNGRAAVGNG